MTNQPERKPRAPAGAVFHRCALQVNPASYAAEFRGAKPTADAVSHAKAIVARAEQLEISVLAITNHNSADDVGAFQDAARGRNVTVFPGFEISSSDGVHVLCIYPPEASSEQLARYLGDLGIQETSPSSDLSSHPLAAVLKKVTDHGGIPIAAHATSDKGLLKALQGQVRVNAWRDPNLLAIQLPGSVDDLPSNLKRILRGEDPEYRRTRPAADGAEIAVVNANDVVAPENLDRPGATVAIKMSKPSIEGFRQAFLDPGSRIRLNSDAPPPDHPELLSVEWQGGFLDGVVVPFHPNLNVAIGGRGAGKSTIVESIRYALALAPVGDAASKAHEGIVRQVLRPGTKVVLRLRVRHPTTAEYRIERTVSNPPVVRDDNGKVSTLAPSDIVPDIEVYGQHEVSEIAASRNKLVRLLDRFVPHTRFEAERKATLRRDLQKARQSIVAIETDLDQIVTELDSLPGLEETLERYRAAKLDDKLKERTLFLREERVLGAVDERFSLVRECLDALQRETPIDRAFLSSDALSELPSQALLATANQPLQHLDDRIREMVQELRETFSDAEATVEDIRRKWRIRKKEAQERYEAILREIGKTAVVAQEYIEIQQHIERLAPLKDKQQMLTTERDAQMTHRRSLCAEWEDLKAEDLRNLNAAAALVNQKLHNKVRVTVVATEDRKPLTELLQREIRGRLAETKRKLKAVPDLSLSALVDACNNGADALVEQYGMPGAQAEALAGISLNAKMEIEELDLRAGLTVELNTARTGESPSWQVLDGLSKGQKATAILLLIMLEPEAPLIIDQPEDDLDNRFITEGVVPMLRDAKPRRQFVMATHNANIPVLGDAELIVGLTPRGEPGDGKATIAAGHIGSIDEQSVRDLVGEILEGGKQAFETRRSKYGF